MAYGAMNFLLENVSCLLTTHTDLLSGAATVSEELRLLMNDLIYFKTVLEPESTRSNKGTQLREVERQIKNVVYAIEDTIDACVTRLAVAAADWKNISGRRRDVINPAPTNLAQQIRSLRKDELKPAMDRLIETGIARVQIGHGKSDGSRQGKQEPRPIKAASIMGDSIISLEDEERRLIESLMKEPQVGDKMRVTTLSGMPGLGKTTLAWKVYHNEKIQREFPTRIWTSVSREFNPRTIFLGILHQFTSKDMSGEKTSDLAKAIRCCLQERRFLLVLDDVWTAYAMSTITSALPWENWRAEVLVTTRHHGVTYQTYYSEAYEDLYYYIMPPQRLRVLTNDEGWQLLQFKVFGKDGNCPPQLQGLGRHISQRCQGIPMLLLTIAGILMDYVSKVKSNVAIVKFWIELSQSLDEYTHSGSDVFRSVLELSYDRMCDELRDCFLYLGVFPEDYEIPAWTLTRLWIAEGFVRPSEGQSLEERAHENLKDLIHRNLVIVDKFKSNGEVKTCRIHDTVHDFCKAQSEGKEHLFQELRKNADATFKRLFLLNNQQQRRICVHSNVLDFFSPEPYAPYVRSFLSFSAEEITLATEDIPKIPGAFELVRILHVKPLVLRIFPLGLTQLALLKYTVLSSDFKALPEAVSRLSNLLTLVIHTSSRTLAIKADIWRSMLQLRDLKTNASITLHKKQPASSGGQHLQTLANISPGDCTLDLFDRAHHLKKLGIRGILAALNFDNLGILNELENLKLLNDDIHEVITPFCLPLPDKFPPMLRMLTISAAFLGWEQMSILGKLDNLEVLKLKDNAFVGRCWEVVPGGFRCLEVLHIGYSDVVSWKASNHDFPRLKCLMLRNCEQLELLPQGLAHVPSLETMVLHRLSKSAVASARNIEHVIMRNRGDCGGGRGIKLSIFPLFE